MSIIDIATLAALLAVVNLYSNNQSSEKAISQFTVWNKDSIFPVFIFLLFFIIKNILGFTLFDRQIKFGYDVATRISGDQLPKYLKGDFQDYVHEDRSVSNRKIQHQPIEFAHYVLSGLQQILTEIVLASLATIAILLYDARLFLLLIVFLLPPLLLASYFSKKKLKKVRQEVKKDAEKSDQYLNEALQGYIEANIYGKIDFFTNRYLNFQKKLNRHLADLQVIQGLPSRLIETFAVTGLFMLIWIRHVKGLNADIISIGAFIAAAYKIIPSIVRIANFSSMVKTYAYTTRGLSGFGKTGQDEIVREHLKSIKFEHVSFEQNENVLFSKLNFELLPGDFARISGYSGKGKTTLINLMLGFLQQKDGTILLNNKNADQQKRINFQTQISYVKQQNFLINDTILKNITFEENDVDETRLLEAILLSGLREFIASDQKGILKNISDAGKNISGGQRQRIAIARAIYKDAPVIILDEPFNELDENAEKELLNNFKNLAQRGKIILLISHSEYCKEYCTKTISLHEH